MDIHIIDNSLKNLGKTVLWQYDKAVRLLAILKHIQVLYHCAVEQLWSYWTSSVLSIDSCDGFGCSVWGILLGVPRPTITDPNTGTTRIVATSVYRRILKGAFYLMKASSSFEDMLGYLEIVFGIDGQDNLSRWTAYVSEYGWKTNVDELNEGTVIRAVYYPRLAYAKNTVFYSDETDSNWLCLKDITPNENTSLQSLIDGEIIEQTHEPASIISQPDTLLLELIDPEGRVRKIGGAPNNSLSISVAYDFGDTTITATATRNRKCGIKLVDNGDMSITYEKSEFYDSMHPDQKALFEQQFDELCPFPLGIRTNEAIENFVFGVTDGPPPSAVLDYQSGRNYAKYVDGSPYTSNNSFKINFEEQINKLIAEGAYCLIRFTENILPLDEYHEGMTEEWYRTNPWYASIVLGRYTTLEAAISANPSIAVYDKTRHYYVGDEVIFDFLSSAYNFVGGEDNVVVPYGAIIVCTPHIDIVQHQNAFFFKLQYVLGDSFYCRQSNMFYIPDTEYHKGDVFGYSNEDGSYNWECLTDISQEENTSFDAIKNKLQKTNLGGPFIDTLGEYKKPYDDVREILSIEEMIADPKSMFSLIAKNRLFVGFDQGVDKIYFNNTDGDFMIRYTSLEEATPLELWHVVDTIGVENPTVQNIKIARAELAKKWGCPFVRYENAIRFKSGVKYLKGEVVLVNNKERIVMQDGVYSDESTLMAKSIPQRRGSLHKFYPYTYK